MLSRSRDGALGRLETLTAHVDDDLFVAESPVRLRVDEIAGQFDLDVDRRAGRSEQLATLLEQLPASRSAP